MAFTPEDLVYKDTQDAKRRLLEENALLEKELSEGYKEEYLDGASCIYTATGNFGDKYKCSWNVWFRENPEKYGFTEVNLKDVKPGDIIQDFTYIDGIPRHALTFIGYDSFGKAKYNYSSGGNDSQAIKKEAYYPYELDYGQRIHFTKDNAEDLQSAIAAYRFVGNEEDNLKWNNDYNQYRKDYSSKVLEELKDVPKLPTDKARILDGTEDEQTTTGLPVGAGLATYNHPKYNHAEEAEMYSYLRSRGVPHVQASAIMGNIAVESMLNPEITQIGGGGGYGLIQATDKSRKNAFINYDGQPYEFGSNISPETQRQLDYIIDKGLNTQTKGEWRGNHNIGRASVARRKFLEATDVNKASKIFTENYLRPGKPHTKRRKSMSNYFNDNYGIAERALEEFENSFLFNDKNSYGGGGIVESYINPSSIEGALGKGVVQLLDPTGISSYPDVYDAGKKFFNEPSWGNFGRLAFETVGALPLVGKVTAPFKAAKVAKIASKIDDLHTLGKIADSATKVNKAIDTLPELIPLTRKAAEHTQDITTKYIVDPLFDMWASKNKYARVRDFKIANALVPIINGANNTADVASTAENVVEIVK